VEIPNGTTTAVPEVAAEVMAAAAATTEALLRPRR